MENSYNVNGRFPVGRIFGFVAVFLLWTSSLHATPVQYRIDWTATFGVAPDTTFFTFDPVTALYADLVVIWQTPTVVVVFDFINPGTVYFVGVNNLSFGERVDFFNSVLSNGMFLADALPPPRITSALLMPNFT